MSTQYSRVQNISINIPVLIPFFHVGFKLTVYLTAPPRLLDAQYINDRASDASTTKSRVGFRQAVIARDGRCVVTNASLLGCEAAHYCPHAKGSEVCLPASSSPPPGGPSSDIYISTSREWYSTAADQMILLISMILEIGFSF